MRFAGHVEDSAPEQPSWAYRPFGAVAWLRWQDGPDMPPQKQFYRVDGDERKNFGEFPIIEGKTYMFKAACWSVKVDPACTDARSGRPVRTRLKHRTGK